MPGHWEGSNRGQRLPSNWPQLREQVRTRAGGRCEATLRDTGERCPATGTDCDHKERGDNHALDNLQWLCPWHHNRKSSREGNAAPRKPKPSHIRPAEQHPGRRS